MKRMGNFLWVSIIVLLITCSRQPNVYTENSSFSIIAGTLFKSVPEKHHVTIKKPDTLSFVLSSEIQPGDVQFHVSSDPVLHDTNLITFKTDSCIYAVIRTELCTIYTIQCVVQNILLNDTTTVDLYDDNIPIDPELINYSYVNIFQKNPSAGIVQGVKTTFGIVIGFPQFTDSIKISFDRNTIDSSLTYTNHHSIIPETLYVNNIYKTTGQKIITVTIFQDDFFLRKDSLTCDVFQTICGVSFSSIPDSHSWSLHNIDTLIFVAETDPPNGPISFSVSSIPVLKSNRLILLSQNTSASVFVKYEQIGNYQIMCIAQAGTVKDTALVSVVVNGNDSLNTGILIPLR